MTDLTWRKHAAVTTGGKPFFYHLVDAVGNWRATVVWNRSVKAYAVEALVWLPNGIRTGRLVAYVGTVAEGKAVARRATVDPYDTTRRTP